MADNLTEADLRENIAEIIKNGDLATLTSKKIRKILEKKYDMDLLHRKKQIDDIVMQLVDEQSDDSDDSDDNASAESPNKSDSGEKSPKEEQETKSERVSVISLNNKQKKKVKAESDSDAEDDLQSESESDDDDPPKTKRRSPLKRSARNEKSKPAKKPKKETGEGGPKKRTGFSKPMLLSPELADLMGETHMARSEVVKKMWQIIRERELLDPTNKRYTICDEQLEKIIGKKRFMTFAMMKYLKKHVKDPAIM